MTTQRDIWDARYRQHVEAGFTPGEASEFARSVSALLTSPSDVLELGCGSGEDAAYLAGQGHRVLATDFLAAEIAVNRQFYGPKVGLTFAVHDTSARLPAASESYDLVYARLSLHYFDDVTTRRVLDDIARVLRPGGLLAFMCRSTGDPEYGRGVEVGPDMFESHHVRHFFSEAYTRDVLAARFDVASLAMRSGELYGDPSAWVEVIARRR